MSEDTVNKLSSDQLYTLMVKTIDEYLILHRISDSTMNVEMKRSELYIIQKVITKRKEQKLTFKVNSLN